MTTYAVGPYTSTLCDYYGLSAMTYVVAARAVSRTGTLLATLEVLGGDLTFDETWAPYVQANLTVRGMTSFDPRLGVRIEIDLGYIYPTGISDIHQAADLALTTMTRDLRNGTSQITAQSDEVLVQRSAQWTGSDIVTTYADFGIAIADVIARAMTPHVPATADFLSTTGAILTNYTLRPMDSYWQHLETLRDAGTGAVFCTEGRAWYIGNAGTSFGAIEPAIGTGEWASDTIRAVVTESEIVDDLDDWANMVIVTHEWTDAATSTAKKVWGSSVATGSYAPSTVGYRVHSERRTVPATAAAAAVEAASMLGRKVQRSRRSRVTALAAYWWRPRYYATIKPGLAFTSERITRVTFDLDGSGLMHLETRDDTPWL